MAKAGENTTAIAEAEDDVTVGSLTLSIKEFRQSMDRETDGFLDGLVEQLRKLDGIEAKIEKEKDKLEDQLEEVNEKLAELRTASEWADLIQEILDREPDVNLRRKFERCAELMRFGSVRDPREIGARTIG